MTKYLLTYLQGDQLMSQVASVYEIADIIGTSALTSRRSFKVYRITPNGTVPMRITGEITSMVITLHDGHFMDSARYIRRTQGGE
jgi:hypothetical protein